jgi:hypothetical protein
VESKPGEGSLFIIQLPHEEMPGKNVSTQKSFAWPLMNESRAFEESGE